MINNVVVAALFCIGLVSGVPVGKEGTDQRTKRYPFFDGSPIREVVEGGGTFPGFEVAPKCAGGLDKVTLSVS